MEVFGWPGKRYSDEDVLNLLRQIELSLASGSNVSRRPAGQPASAMRHTIIGASGTAGWAKSQLQELKGLEKENTRLKRIVADLELDKLILKESPQLPKAEGLTIADLRQAVIHVRQKLGSSKRRDCRTIGVARSTQRYEACS